MGRLEIKWDPSDRNDPGPCIKVVIMNSSDVIGEWRALGLDCPEPRAVTALIDTGASVTVISKVFANHCKLFQTGEGRLFTTLAGRAVCGEHAGAISFPGTDLGPVDSHPIVSANFVGERNYSCLIGRDILRNWLITFDGRAKRVVIED
jgi:predicted aspartyl protease